MPQKNRFSDAFFLIWILFPAPLSGQDFDLQAHRGGRDRRPENTLVAFSYAVGLGVTTLELDTAVTKDRAVVVSHDPRLNPNLVKDAGGSFLASNEETFIKDLTLSGLKRYTVGELKPGTSYYYAHREQRSVPGETIPTLAEVFELTQSLKAGSIRFNIEIKTYPPHPDYTIDHREFVRLVLEVIRDHRIENRVTIQSFDWRTLKLAKELAPEIWIACLMVRNFSIDGASYNLQPGRPGPSPWLAGFDFDNYRGSVSSLVKDFGGDIVSPYYKEIAEKDVREAHRLGLKIIPWTINDERTMRKLIDWGVDGIITDRPDVLKKVLEE